MEQHKLDRYHYYWIEDQARNYQKLTLLPYILVITICLFFSMFLLSRCSTTQPFPSQTSTPNPSTIFVPVSHRNHSSWAPSISDHYRWGFLLLEFQKCRHREVSFRSPNREEKFCEKGTEVRWNLIQFFVMVGFRP